MFAPWRRDTPELTVHLSLNRVACLSLNRMVRSMTGSKVCVAALLLTASAATLAADCSREDIDHYLDRGFTPQQVVALCRSESSVSEALPSTENASYWRDVVDAVEVSLDADALSFRRDQCVEYDRPNYAEQRKKACGKVSYRIGLDGLKVLDTKQQLLFWGANALIVSSPDIRREYALGQNDLRSRDQRLLATELEQGDRATIPLRDGVAAEVAGRKLQALADSRTKKTAP